MVTVFDKKVSWFYNILQVSTPQPAKHGENNKAAKNEKTALWRLFVRL